EGVDAARGGHLTAMLFQARTRQVLDQRSPASNAGFLSGLLIGAELAGLSSDGRPVVLAAGPPLSEAYALAAQVLGFGDRMRIVVSGPLSAIGQAVVLRRLQGGVRA
ncbi:MAG: 2-dehydro-3-deoxygalactonokinase, partial [Verrucomicrobiota bacterium]